MTPPLYQYDRVGSTMDVIHQFAEDGAETGTIVVAGEQLDGRGSRGRTWHSPPGGLWLSALFRPPAAGGIEVMSLRVGLAVADALEPLLSLLVQVKWPNDLMVGERKVGGILCEARWQGGALAWVAVGVGVNVRNPVPDELGQAAVSLAQVRPEITIDDVLVPIVAALRRIDLQAERLSPLELNRFAQRDWLSGREIGAPVRGRVRGLGEDGALLVQIADRSEIPLRSGSVELAAASPDR
ncbi:MAG TPA: biotin--[acetyl-CoA-carboxylase] ligase [Gemmatimonadales bacterium]|nr:biotin--[acetyl-CoA-carboxylase] ligase [Gemmatimonadales bacterium]